jgi:polar amino acid transport system substrate-binding protein
MALSSTTAKVVAFSLPLLCAACNYVGPGRGEAPLRIGVDFTYPPFQMLVKMAPGTEVAPDGLHKEIDGSIWEMDGVSVRLAEALAKDLDRRLEIHAMPFRDLIPALQEGRIDLIVSSLSITEKRRDLIDFSDPYVHTGLAMLVRYNSPIDSLDDLRMPGRKVIVRQGTSSFEFAKSQLPATPLDVIQESGLGEQMVMDDPDAAFINDELMLWRMHRRLPARTKVLAKLLTNEFWGIGIHRGDGAMRSRVNAFLARFRAEQGFQQLSDRYLSDEEAFLKGAKQPLLFL